MMGIFLVTAQAAFCVALLWLGWGGVSEHPRLWIVVALGVAICASGVWAMRKATGRVKVTPEPGAGSTLCRRGIYAHIRHPMYAGLLLAFAGIAPGTGGWIGWLLWTGLFAVLLGKLKMEERLWAERDPAYREYRRRTKRLIPRVW